MNKPVYKPHQVRRYFYHEAKTLTAVKQFLDKFSKDKPRKEKATNCYIKAAQYIYQDYIRKASTGKAHGAKLRITSTNIAADTSSTRKTAYNRLARLLTTGLISAKGYAVEDFGKGKILCLELTLNPTVVQYQDTVIYAVNATVDKSVGNQKPTPPDPKQPTPQISQKTKNSDGSVSAPS